MRINLNYFFSKRYWWIELRYVKSKMRGSFPLIGIHKGHRDLSLVIYPLVFNIHIMTPLRSAPLADEEKKIAEELED